MKSILQEGSSVFKAVEQAWSTAGKPQEFTVRVLETESRNFFGITTKPAIISKVVC
jgi:predicted RNA-binding protein Jag